MKNLLFFTFLALLFHGIFACKQSDANSGALAAAGKDNPVHPFMEPDKAVPAINAWRQKRKQIDTALGTLAPGDTTYIARGFHIPYNDIKGLLQATSDTNSIFGMLAIQYDSTQRPPRPQITLIFQAKDATGTIRYYDFTQGCPSNCPSNQ